MPGPARAGALIYAHDLTRLTSFYETLLAMRRVHEGDGYVVLESNDAQLVIHAIPPHIAATFSIASPPELREEGAIKLFFAVPSLTAAAAAAPALGGAVFGPEYDAGVFRARNAHDPEGNIIQVREFEVTGAAAPDATTAVPGSTSSTAVLWRRLDQPGHDLARVVEGPGGVVIEGTALFEEGGEPCRLDYRVLCDGQWRTRLATVSGWWGLDTIDLEIAVDASGQWTIDGEPCPQVAGCLDVDLSFTPATNLLPIRRLALADGARAEVRAAWLRFPECTLAPLDQVYAHTSSGQYHYESNGGRFTATLETDAAGIVRHYSGLWQREPATD